MRELESLDGDLDDAIKASLAWRMNEDLFALVPGVGRAIARTLYQPSLAMTLAAGFPSESNADS